MTTTVLTDEQVGDLYQDWHFFFKNHPGGAANCIRAIEQAVLQSEQVQAWKKDAERFRFLRDNAQLFSHFGNIGNSGWCVMRRDSAINRVFTYNGQELIEAIDAAMENQK